MSTTNGLSATADQGGSLTLAGVFGPSRLFHLELNRARFEAFSDCEVSTTDDATVVSGTVAGTSITAKWSARALDPSAPAAWELGLTLTNAGTTAVTVTRMDPLAAHLVGGRWTTLSFRSAWGDEFRPVHGTTDHHHLLESRSGRSSHGCSPWLGLELESADQPHGLVVCPAWSGNWHIDVSEGSRVSAGISTWLFATELAPGASVTAPSVVIATGESMDAAATALTSALGRAWVPRSAASDRLDVEWNHWWPYEDAEVTEDVIWQNAAIAADLGVGVATVDAGWFGPADPATYWGDYRGDWALVNTARFPSGLGRLGAGIREAGKREAGKREAGLRAGIWVEAEAIGSLSGVRSQKPEILALAVDGRRHDPSYEVGSQSLDPDDPTFLGYVCLGSAAGRAFVAESLDRVVRDMGAQWVKLDFNVDPDAGCTRTDHGHGAMDGLFRHYEGLYRVLDEFRERHPEVVLEACSSGGLRQDVGLARHVHCLFLSDPDYTEHALQVFWGSSLMLPPASILHWSWSQWRGDYPPSQLDFASLSQPEFDTMLRAAMLHRFGFSLRLPELSEDQLDSVRQHTRLYNDHLAAFVRDGVLHRLTAQPLRGGFGERTPAFQLSLGDRHVIAQYRLDGGATPVAVRPVGLGADTDWRVTDLVTGQRVTFNSGIPIADAEASSWLFLVEPN